MCAPPAVCWSGCSDQLQLLIRLQQLTCLAAVDVHARCSQLAVMPTKFVVQTSLMYTHDREQPAHPPCVVPGCFICVDQLPKHHLSLVEQTAAHLQHVCPCIVIQTASSCTPVLARVTPKTGA